MIIGINPERHVLLFIPLWATKVSILAPNFPGSTVGVLALRCPDNCGYGRLNVCGGFVQTRPGPGCRTASGGVGGCRRSRCIPGWGLRPRRGSHTAGGGPARSTGCPKSFRWGRCRNNYPSLTWRPPGRGAGLRWPTAFSGQVQIRVTVLLIICVSRPLYWRPSISQVPLGWSSFLGRGYWVVRTCNSECALTGQLPTLTI